MSIRQKLTDNPAIAAVAAVLIIGSAVWMTMGPRHRPVADQCFYFNLDENKVFADAIGQTPPFKTVAGHTAVVAAVFSCGNCADTASRFVGYLEKYSDELLQAMASGNPVEPDVAKLGHVVRTETGTEWVPSSTPTGQKIVEAIQKRCGDDQPKACQP